MALYDLLDRVTDRESFLAFVRALTADRADDASGRPAGWENGTIEAYLGAALAWAEASLGRDGGLPEQPSYKAFAVFLYCGKVYE